MFTAVLNRRAITRDTERGEDETILLFFLRSWMLAKTLNVSHQRETGNLIHSWTKKKKRKKREGGYKHIQKANTWRRSTSRGQPEHQDYQESKKLVLRQKLPDLFLVLYSLCREKGRIPAEADCNVIHLTMPAIEGTRFHTGGKNPYMEQSRGEWSQIVLL